MNSCKVKQIYRFLSLRRDVHNIRLNHLFGNGCKMEVVQDDNDIAYIFRKDISR